MSAAIPDKKYFKIGEVSRLSELEPHVLRFWESEFHEINPKKDGGNQRLYRRKDVETIFKIKRLLYEEKFTIAGAKVKLREETSPGQREPDSPKVREIKEGFKAIKKSLTEIRSILS